ncbi:MAG: hypothetical protein ACTSRP_18535 [Candidatus Helarchaeota archaeon]
MAQEYENNLGYPDSNLEIFSMNFNSPVLGTINIENKMGEFKLDIEQLMEGLLVCGDKYTGKSSIIKRLLLQIIEDTSLNCLLFDLNNEYNKFLDSKWISRETWTIEFGKENFAINPLELIMDRNDKHLISLVDIFRTVFNLNIEETYILKEFISSLIQDSERPTLSDLLLYLELEDEIVNIFNRDVLKRSITHLKNILTGLTHGPMKDIVDVEYTNFNIENLQDSPIIIKFDNLGKSAQNFIQNLYFLDQLIYKVKSKSKNPHLMVFDPIEVISPSLLKMRQDIWDSEGLLATICAPLRKNKLITDLFENFVILQISMEEDIKLITCDRISIDENEIMTLNMGESIVILSNSYIYKVSIEDFYF